ncbi:hypothetical protein BX600DRAFT_474887 [Xylariales sp. PMI_506]|nr:hypothetical protein BX600DRAFT_474887 [Xylariales sp. PMI_506]
MPRPKRGFNGVARKSVIGIVGVLGLIPTAIGIGLFWWAGVHLPLHVYLVFSLSSFLLYGYDKHRATNSGWRVREVMLHSLDFVGGWPGGMLAQGFFRHKTRKTSFQIVFWATVLLHDSLWLRWILS